MRTAHAPTARVAMLIGCIGAALLAIVATQPRAASAQTTGVPACRAVGWQPVSDASGNPMGSVSSLTGGPAMDRVYAGSRYVQDPNGQMRSTLYSWPLVNPVFQPEQAVNGFRITDLASTPGKATTLWASTLGAGDDFRGPVLGGTSGSDLTARGQLRSWFMELAVTDSNVFTAVSEAEDRGVYRWDETTGQWQLMGAEGIDTTLFRVLQSGRDGRLWLGADRSGVWRSADDAASWQPVGDRSWTPWSLAVSPSDANMILAGLGAPEGDTGVGGYPRGLRISRDGGDSWQQLPLGHGQNRNDELANAALVTALAFSRSMPSSAVAAAWYDGLFVTHDGGASWQYLPSPAGQRGYFEALLTVIPPGEPGCELLFAAGANGTWYMNLRGEYHKAFVPLAAKRAVMK